jgi:hypothetical protein
MRGMVTQQSGSISANLVGNPAAARHSRILSRVNCL